MTTCRITRTIHIARHIAAACTLLAASLGHAAVAVPGDLIVTEVMANPQAVSDTAGEWFELYNNSDHRINLDGLTIADDGSNSHTIDAPTLGIDAGGYAVLARNGDSTTNGGFNADYVYHDFTLGNSSDEIVLRRGTTELFRLDYSGATFATAGVSAELALWDGHADATDYQLTPARFTFGDGDRGTPGAAGSWQPTPVAAVPLPAAGWLFGASLAMLLGRRRRAD